MKLLYNEHIWDRFIHVYSTGEDGFKKVADKLGLDRGSAAHRLRRLNLPKKIHVSTRKKLIGIRQINELNRALKRKWNALIKRVRSPIKPTRDQMNARVLKHYHETKHLRKDKIRQSAKAHYDRNKADPLFMQRKRDALKRWKLKHPEEAKCSRSNWATRNPEKSKQCRTNWRNKNPDKVRAYKRRHDNKPHRLLIRRLRTRLKQLIANGKAKRQSIRKLIGCTPAHLLAHIEAQFTTGMGWHNRSAWHIDHIRPCASFNMNDPIQLSQCWHWTNLQPLWAYDNIAKGAKYSCAA